MRYLRASRVLRRGLFILVLPLLSASQLAAAHAQGEVTNYGRGPFELEDQFPLALNHLNLMPSSPEVLAEGQWRFRLPAAWTNTVNRKHGSYLIDAELRNFYPELSFSPVSTLELKAKLPILWRGGGELDSPIYRWHDFFGMPQGPRDDPDLEDNDFIIEGNNRGGGYFEQTRSGAHFGDLQVSAKLELTRGSASFPAVSTELSLGLPTGAKEYGSNGLDLGAALLASKRYKSFILYGGAGYTYFDDTNLDSLYYVRHRASGFLSLEWQPDYWVSFVISFSASSKLIERVKEFPDYSLYLDYGAKLDLSDSVELELMMRENPAPSDGTADVSFYVGLSHLI